MHRFEFGLACSQRIERSDSLLLEMFLLVAACHHIVTAQLQCKTKPLQKLTNNQEVLLSSFNVELSDILLEEAHFLVLCEFTVARTGRLVVTHLFKQFVVDERLHSLKV